MITMGQGGPRRLQGGGGARGDGGEGERREREEGGEEDKVVTEGRGIGELKGRGMT